MAHLERLLKSFEVMKIYAVPNNKQPLDKHSTSTPILNLKQQSSMNKSDYITHCSTIIDCMIHPSVRSVTEFPRYLSSSMEAFLFLCNDDDADIRLAASDGIDKLCLALCESHLSRLQVDLYKTIEKNGPSRTLRVALIKFGEFIGGIRPFKYRTYASKLLSCVVKIIPRTDDEQLQEVLMQFIQKMSPVLVCYATDKEIIAVLVAYLAHLGSPSHLVRRVVALSIVTICNATRRPYQFFHWLMNNLLALLSTVKVTGLENSEKLFSGIFTVVRFACPKVMPLLSVNPLPSDLSTQAYELMFDNLIFIYQHLLTSIKYSNSNIVIVAALEALIEFYNNVSHKIFHRISSLCEGCEQWRSNWPPISSRPPSALSGLLRHDAKYESNLSINSSINYIENINDDLNDEAFQKSGISLYARSESARTGDFVSVSEFGDGSEFGENLDEVFSEVIFDQESELDSSMIDSKLADLDNSEYSSANYQSRFSLDEPSSSQPGGGGGGDGDDALDEGESNINHFSLGPLYSLEYAAKLVSLKNLLQGEQGKLIADSSVRVSIKGLALSCFASLVHIYPEALLCKVCNEDNGQALADVLLYAQHSDPNIRGAVAMIISRYLDKVLFTTNSYEEFVCQQQQANNLSACTRLSLSTLLEIVCKLLQDSSAICIKQTLIALQHFIEKLFRCNELPSEHILNLIQVLLGLRTNTYWLVRVELINLLSHIPYSCLLFVEKNSAQSTTTDCTTTPKTTAMRTHSLSKCILEELIFPSLFDTDHRIRQAVNNVLGLFITNLCLNHHTNGNDPVNVVSCETIVRTFGYQHQSRSFDNTTFPSLCTVMNPFDYSRQVDSVFAVNVSKKLHNTQHSSNLLYFVRRLLFELRKNYHKKCSLVGCISALSTLARLYPPSEHLQGWQLDRCFWLDTCAVVFFLIDLLSKNQSIMFDLSVHQNLMTLIIELLEGIMVSFAKHTLPCSNNNNDGTGMTAPNNNTSHHHHHQPQQHMVNDVDVYAYISPHLVQYVQTYFVHLLKIIVSYAAIVEENGALFITFIFNMYSKNHFQLSTMLRKRGATKIYSAKEESALRKELCSKGSKKQESQAFDPLYHKLFDYLKNHHRNKKANNRGDKYVLLSATLANMAKLLELCNTRLALHYTEEMLIYLKIVFYLDPTGIIQVVKHLLKSIFGINYLALLVDAINNELVDVTTATTTTATTKVEQQQQQQSSVMMMMRRRMMPVMVTNENVNNHNQNSNNSNNKTTISTLPQSNLNPNSLYNTCLTIPYVKLNDFYNTYRDDYDHHNHNHCDLPITSGTCFSWLQRQALRKLSKTLEWNVADHPLPPVIENDTKKMLTRKLQFFEPLVIKSLKHCLLTSDMRFQSATAELLSQLVQLHVNYCLLDTNNNFIQFVFKQYEFLESVLHSRQYEWLMKRLFFFLITLSNGHYLPEEIVNIPKVIQLCDALIANGHYQMALDGLYIIVDDIFYGKINGDDTTMNVTPELEENLEAQREVILAYCFKLLDYHHQTFDLLTLILNHYRHTNQEKWSNLSTNVMEQLVHRLMSGNIILNSIESFECLQTLLYSLCTSSQLHSCVGTLQQLFVKHYHHINSDGGGGGISGINSSSGKSLEFCHWFANVLLFFKLTLLNLNESQLLTTIAECHQQHVSSSDFTTTAAAAPSGDNDGGGGGGAQCSSPSLSSLNSEEILCNFLLSTLQMAVSELHRELARQQMQHHHHYHSTTTTPTPPPSPPPQQQCTFIGYLLTHYNLLLTFMFQSGFYPKITSSAINLIGGSTTAANNAKNLKNSNNTMHNAEVNEVIFDLEHTGSLFLKLHNIHSNLTISWLNLLYLLNYKNLPQTLSRLIEYGSTTTTTATITTVMNGGGGGGGDGDDRVTSVQIRSTGGGGGGGKCNSSRSSSVHSESVKRFGLIFMCDYLSENLENVEFLTWLVINYLQDIVTLCHEMPVKEFINSIHRKSSSSGLFVQAINSRCEQLLDERLFALKVLHCLERAHSSQSLPVVMFLLEKFLFNCQLMPYYKCRNYAETIATNRLVSMYDHLHFGRLPPDDAELASKHLLSIKDMTNLKRILKRSPFVRLKSTVQTIIGKFYPGTRCSSGKKSGTGTTTTVIRDPLSVERNVVPEINKKWFTDILQRYWSSPHHKLPNAMYFLSKLTNEDIIALLASDHYLLYNHKQVLTYLVERHNLRLGLNMKISSSSSSSSSIDQNRADLARHILQLHTRYMKCILTKFSFYETRLCAHKIVLPQELSSLAANDSQCGGDQSFVVGLAQSFAPSYHYLMENLTTLELQANWFEISNTEFDVNLLIVYCVGIHQAHQTDNITQLLSLLALLNGALHNKSLFAKLSKKDNVHLQSSLIHSLHHLLSNDLDLSDEIVLPHEVTAKIENDPQLLTTQMVSAIQKMLTLLHCLEMNKCFVTFDRQQKSEHLPGRYHNLWRDIVYKLCHLPLVNSLAYVPYSLFISPPSAHFWHEYAANGYPSTAAIGAQYLNELELIKQFYFRIYSLGFVSRIQFEEIWMTLLGVFSDSLRFLNEAKHKSDTNEHIVQAQWTIRALTVLLYQANQKRLSTNVVDVANKQYELQRRIRHTLGDRYTAIRANVQSQCVECTSTSQPYNRPSRETLFGLHYEPVPIEQLRENMQNFKQSPAEDFDGTGGSGNTKSEFEVNNIDCYSCIQLLLDLYLQTSETEVSRSLVSFPLLCDIAKSCYVVSDYFVERSQYHKLQLIMQQLAKVAEVYGDELLNQFVIVTFAKTYAVLSSTDEPIEKYKKAIVEQYLKDFFIPARISAIRSVKYLIECPHTITNRDLVPIWEYICQHLPNEHTIPSSYCVEYVNELWGLAFVLLERYNNSNTNTTTTSTMIPSTIGEHHNQLIAILLRALSRKRNVHNLAPFCTALERLLLTTTNGVTNSMNIEAINGAVLAQLNASTNQLNTIQLLNLYILTLYLLGPRKSPHSQQQQQPSPSTDDELFLSMEQLSTVFEPLKWCNSIEANVICQVMGYFLVDFFPAQDLLNKCIGEFLSNQQSHHKYLTNILFVIFNKFQNDFHHTDTAQDWVILSLSSFTQLVPISHALWALTCFLMSASQNHWIRASYPYFQSRFGQFSQADKRLFFVICNNFYNEIKSDENKMAFIKTFQKAACLANSPYFDVLKYLCDR